MNSFGFRSPSRVTRGAAITIALGMILTITTAGAATIHRLAVSQATGSLGATTFLQSNASSSALQGEVASSARTNISIPFGVLGEYDAPGSKFGIGIAGISTTGYGVSGESLGNNASVIGYAGGTGTAVEGVTPATSSAAAFTGVANGSGDGGDFTANTSGVGAYALAKSSKHMSGQGLFAQNDSMVASALAAVNTGPTAAPAYLYQGEGMYASSTGVGVFAQSSSDAALVAEISCNDATVAFTSDETGLAGSRCAGLYVVQEGAGFPLLVFDPVTHTYPLYLTSDGDLSTEGTVSATQFISRSTSARTDEMTYGAKQTESTVEDFGRAKLVNGTATVALRSDYLATIDSSAPYMVFLTPHGENRGLFVESMTSGSFVIRESYAGRSNLAFDYRIVAQPAGVASRRLPHASTLKDAGLRSVAHRGIDVESARRNATLRNLQLEAKHRIAPAAIAPMSP